MYVPGFLVLRFSGYVPVYLLCTSMYIPGFLVLRFSGYVPVYSLCTSGYVPGFLVLRFSGFCLSEFMFVPVCTYLGFWF